MTRNVIDFSKVGARDIPRCIRTLIFVFNYSFSHLNPFFVPVRVFEVIEFEPEGVELKNVKLDVVVYFNK